MPCIPSASGSNGRGDAGRPYASSRKDGHNETTTSGSCFFCPECPYLSLCGLPPGTFTQYEETLHGSIFAHLRVGQASRPAIRRPQFRAEARTHFAIRSRRAEKETGRCPVIDSATCRVLRCCSKEELFFSVMESPTDSSPVCLVGRCVGRIGAGWPYTPCPANLGQLGRLWRELRQPAQIPFLRVSGSEETPGSLGFHFQLALSKTAPQLNNRKSTPIKT